MDREMTVGKGNRRDTGFSLLELVAGYYGREVEYDIRNLSDAIQPILIIAIGALVFLLALGVFLPMWDLGHVALGR